jgi:hypothetical protein
MHRLCLYHDLLSGYENYIVWATQPDIVSEKPLQDYIIVPRSYSETQNYVIEITEMVKYWLLNPENNFGMCLSLLTEQPYRRAFWASSNNSNHNKRPKLVLQLKLKEQ